jgi:sugar lactone lactonase YvrE
VILAGLISAGAAFGAGDPESETQEGPFSSIQASRRQLELALESTGDQKVEAGETDPEAAASLPRHDLERPEAEELLTSVFEPQLLGSAQPFDELEVQHYLGNFTALVTPKSDPFSPRSEGSDTALVESTVPLRTEDSDGQNAPVSLDLERAGRDLRPENSLTEVEIPGELGEGIELPEAGVSIELPDGPDERAPTVVNSTTAFYPNVAPDTDFSVVPTATGVETLTQLRTAAAPTRQEFEISISDGGKLVGTESGGAEILRDGERVLSIPAPMATDATGAEVPTSLSIDGDRLVVSTETSTDTAFPVLVDPTYDYYAWSAETAPGHAGWGSFNMTTGNTWQPWMSSPWGGLYGPTIITGYPGTVVNGTQANWFYQIPRFAEEAEHGNEPTSFIQSVTVSGVELWMAGNVGQRRDSPYMLAGIFDKKYWRWAAVAYRNGIDGGLQHWGTTFYARNDQGEVDTHATWFQIGFASSEDGANENRWVTDPVAMIELSDNDYPFFQLNAGPSQWVNTTSAGAPIHFEVSDSGLGMYDAFVGALLTNGEFKYFGTHYNSCVGSAARPCPRTWSWLSGPQLNYDPSILPNGEDYVTLTATDPIGHDSAWKSESFKPQEAKLKVDHTAPNISVTGSVTEQEILGTSKPAYTVNYKGTDGTHAAAQATTPLGSLGSGASQFNTPQGLATDRKGHVWVVDRANNRVQEFNESGGFIRQFGSKGSGNGQLLAPYAITVTSEGNIWVADAGNYRVEEFSPTGEYMQQFGTAGTGGGTQFSSLGGIASAPGGLLWVSDWGGHRIGEFRENPGGSERFVRNVSGASTEWPNGLTVDSRGYLWAVDDGCFCVKSFGPTGQYVSQFGSAGSGLGQLNAPTFIAATPTGNLLVTDRENNRIEEFKPSGEFVRAFGSAGSGNGNLNYPEGLALLQGNVLWVADAHNNRIARWSGAEYDPQSGAASLQIKVDGKVEKSIAPGCPERDCEINGEWTLESSKYSDGAHNVEVVATDGVGLSSPVAKVPIVLYPDRTAPTVSLSGPMTEQASLGATRPRYTLKAVSADPGAASRTNYVSAFGSNGSGNGQFKRPSDVAIDSKGNVWVVDKPNNRIQEFSEGGAFIRAVGSLGSAGGQLNSPSGIAIDSYGMIDVTDTGNNRVVRFNENGVFDSAIGANVDKTKVQAGGTLAEKNHCTAASGDVCQAGTASAEEGFMSEPIGIAASSEGKFFVVERANNRVEKFNLNGEKEAKFSRLGSEETISKPMAVAVAPNGNLWVADTGRNEVAEWGPTYAFIRKFGTAGTGNGQFSFPNAIEVDPSGNVWVGDSLNNRVEVFSETGEFLGKFGTSGTGPGQFASSEFTGLQTDAKGNIWITDGLNARVEKWRYAEPTSSGVASAQIRVDGNIVDSVAPGCPSGACSITREWTLNSNSYSAGSHTVVVKATDAVGLTTEKTTTINIARDTTPPQITANASLYTAPEGWVEQQPYPYTASASDPNGYGITSLVLKIDGETVKSVSQSCADGSCGASITGSLNVAEYEGGAHPAELIATDGAGNITREKWTMNVDPEGHVSNSESEQTMEALEQTSQANLVGPAQEEGIEGTGTGLGVSVLEGEYIAEGSNVPTTISSGADEVTMGIPEAAVYAVPCAASSSGEPPEEEESAPCLTENNAGELTDITVEQVGVDGGVAETKSANGEAVIRPNTGPEADTAIRPLSDGALAFQMIRDASAPEVYSWRVQLEPGQELRQISETEVAAYFDGGHLALDFFAEPASDAIGSTVRTTLSLTGSDVVTLTIHHHEPSPTGGPFIYPIVAGTGWQGGFQTQIVEMPPPEQAPEEPGGGEEIEASYGRISSVTIGAPVGETAQASSEPAPIGPAGVPVKGRPYIFNECRFGSDVGEGEDQPPKYPPDTIPPEHIARLSRQCHGLEEGAYGNTFYVTWAVAVHGRFSYRFGKKVWISKLPQCTQWNGSFPDALLPELKYCYAPVTYSPEHIDVLGDWRWNAGTFESHLAPFSDVCGELDGVLPVRPTDPNSGEWVYSKRWHWSIQAINQQSNCPWGSLAQHVH